MIAINEKMLREAMQNAWNDYVADTGCLPSDFSIHGPKTTRVSADFIRGDFAKFIISELEAEKEDCPKFSGSPEDSLLIRPDGV